MAKAAGILPAGRNPSAPEGSVKPAPPPNPPKAQEIEALRAKVERVTCELMDAITRADKLAEALREAADMLLADYPETAKRMRAACCPTAAQENDDA